jgi:hypothetical protein
MNPKPNYTGAVLLFYWLRSAVGLSTLAAYKLTVKTYK